MLSTDCNCPNPALTRGLGFHWAATACLYAPRLVSPVLDLFAEDGMENADCTVGVIPVWQATGQVFQPTDPRRDARPDQTGQPSASSQSRPNQLFLLLLPQIQPSAWCTHLHVSKLPSWH